jgi:hypothetical protein
MVGMNCESFCLARPTGQMSCLCILNAATCLRCAILNYLRAQANERKEVCYVKPSTDRCAVVPRYSTPHVAEQKIFFMTQNGLLESAIKSCRDKSFDLLRESMIFASD